jgi:hypothetical protein
MAESALRFRIEMSEEEAAALATAVRAEGATAKIDREKGLLPLAVLLVLAIPPGTGLLALVVNRIVHSWRTGGVVIDARGAGEPIIRKDRDLPFGTVVVLSRDGEVSKRTDLPEPDVAKYVAAVMKGLGGGAASESK